MHRVTLQHLMSSEALQLFLPKSYSCVFSWYQWCIVGSSCCVEGFGPSREFQRWTLVFQNMFLSSHDPNICYTTTGGRHRFRTPCIFSTFFCKDVVEVWHSTRNYWQVMAHDKEKLSKMVTFYGLWPNIFNTVIMQMLTKGVMVMNASLGERQKMPRRDQS